MIESLILVCWFGWIVANVSLAQFGGRMTKPSQQAAYTTGLFPPKIFIAEELASKLTERQQQALIAHELGHVARGHVWINLLKVCVFWFPSKETRRQQEFQADDFAFSRGYGLDLAEALAKLSKHPFDVERVRRLVAFVRSYNSGTQSPGIGATT
jgi:Zn-dependent protease with chaperone function